MIMIQYTNFYQAVATSQSYGSFEVESAKGIRERLIVSSYDTDYKLMISGQNARTTFSSITEDNYCEDMGIEGFFSYHLATEKND